MDIQRIKCTFKKAAYDIWDEIGEYILLTIGALIILIVICLLFLVMKFIFYLLELAETNPELAVTYFGYFSLIVIIIILIAAVFYISIKLKRAYEWCDPKKQTKNEEITENSTK